MPNAPQGVKGLDDDDDDDDDDDSGLSAAAQGSKRVPSDY
jgi:hypothetical protein